LTLAFKSYDRDKSGWISEEEFKNIMIDMGRRDITDDQVKEMMAQADEVKDGRIVWNEFINLFVKIKSQNQDLFKKVLNTKMGEMN